MRCPYCGNTDTSVKDSRAIMAGTVIRRRRECTKCEKRFTTYERIESELPLIIKKDARRENFNRSKVLAGLMRACEKRPISSYQMDKIINKIEAQLMEKGVKEIDSDEIGKLVMSQLKELDKVAFVRFASVYRDFQDIGEFSEVISDLENNNEVSEEKETDNTEIKE